jgi:hypothetical protein
MENTNKPPLEIINENNLEASNKESRDKATPESDNIYKRKKSDNMKKEEISKISSLKNDLLVEFENKDLMLNNISNIQTERKDGEGHETIDYNKMAEDNANTIKPEERLHYLAITSIIPENKLLSANDDEIMFQSNLKRLLNQKVNYHISQNFADRFVICTKTMLKLYKSKEQFLKLNKPVNIIPISKIKSSNRFSLNQYSSMKLHFFVIEFNDIVNKGI